MKIWKFSASGLLRGVVAAAFAGAVVLGFALPAQASLLNDEVTLVSQFGPCNPCSDTVTVGGGIEFTNDPLGGSNVEQMSLALIPTGPGASFIDIGASSITIQVLGVQFTSNFELQDMDWLPDPGTITGISLDAASTVPNDLGGLAGLLGVITNEADGSKVNFTLNCTGACTGGTFIINFATEHVPVVPEPSTVSVFGVGLGMLGLMVMWRRRKAA